MRQAVADLGSQPIRNRSASPRAQAYTAVNSKVMGFVSGRFAANTAYSVVTGATDGPGLATYVRGTVTAAAGGMGFHLAENPEVGIPGQIRLVAVGPGQAYGLSIWLRSSVTIQWIIRVRFSDDVGWLGTSGAVYPQTTVSLTAGVWTRVQITGAVPAGSTGMGAYVICPSGQGNLPVGATFDATGQVFTLGDAHPAAYVDGDTPGWRWTGATGASESVGYPQIATAVTAPPLSLWTLSGGATYDPALDEITIPNISAAAISPPVPTVGMGTIATSFEYYSTIDAPQTPGSGGRLLNTTYYGPDKATLAFNTQPSPGPYSGNGAANTYPQGVWTKQNNNFTLGPNISFVVVAQRGSASWATSYKFRKPTMQLI